VIGGYQAGGCFRERKKERRKKKGGVGKKESNE
jgi:hypothetical protein